MNKQCLVILIVLLAVVVPVFAQPRKLALNYIEKPYSTFDILYNGVSLDEEGSNLKQITLEDKESSPITIKWNYNIGNSKLGDENTGLNVMFVAPEGLRHTAEGVNDGVDVFFDIKLRNEANNICENVANSSIEDKDTYNHGVLSFSPKLNMRGSTEIADVIVRWPDHKWIAGEYQCSIYIFFSVD